MQIKDHAKTHAGGTTKSYFPVAGNSTMKAHMDHSFCAHMHMPLIITAALDQLWSACCRIWSTARARNIQCNGQVELHDQHSSRKEHDRQASSHYVMRRGSEVMITTRARNHAKEEPNETT